MSAARSETGVTVANGTKLKLDPSSDFTHTPGTVSNYNESMYFHGFDAQRQVGLWVRLGNRPNEGHAEMSCCVYLPDGRVGFMYGRPKITDNTAMSAGGMNFEVVEPFKHLKVVYSGEVLLMDRPIEMENPGAAFKANPKVACCVDLDFTGISPMFGGETVNMDGSPLVLGEESGSGHGHTEQHMAVRGRITVGDQCFDIDGFGYRDKSWGPRHWNNFHFYKWLTISFGPDFGVMLTCKGDPGQDAPSLRGHVFSDGCLHPVHDVKWESEYDEKYFQKSLIVRFCTADREYSVEGKVVSSMPLRHRRTMPDGSESFSRIIQAMTQYRCEGRTAYGMSEYFDLMVDGRPISLAQES